METGTQLNIVERAQVALGSSQHEAKLRELVEHAKGVTAINSPATYAECHGARMGLKNARVAIEKAGKAAREDATAYSRGIIAEEKRLIGIGSAEEDRLQKIQDAHDERVAREKEARERAEAERVERIKGIIQDLRAIAIRAVGKSSIVITELISDLAAQWSVDQTMYAEFFVEAETAKVEAEAKLSELLAAAIEHEAERERARQDRIELARLKAEEDERQRKAAAEERVRLDKIAADERAAADHIATQDREAQAERDKADREARERREAQAAADKAAFDEETKRLAAEQARINRESRELEEKLRQERTAQEDRERAEREAADLKARQEREAEETKEREAKRKINESLDARQMLLAFVAQYGHIKEFAKVCKAIDAALAPKESKVAHV